jgi:hypothetical protein
MEEKSKVGRPLKFKTPEEMQVEIDKYFDSCFRPVRVFIKDTNKYINLTDENEEIIKEQYKPFTMSGLAYALGMSRQALLNYSERDEFVDTITRAKQKCEIYAEERLFDKDGNRGAVFSLSNNFKGWADKQTIETTKEPTININMINNEKLEKDFFDKEE